PRNNPDLQRMAMEIDEFDRGYPRLTLTILMDIVAACMKVADAPRREGKSKDAEPSIEFTPQEPQLATPRGLEVLRRRIYGGQRIDHAVSWGALLGRLGRLSRLKVFDVSLEGARPLNYKSLLESGTVSVIDLSDSGMSELNNIVIADLLRGV